jgi:hypothetical protein
MNFMYGCNSIFVKCECLPFCIYVHTYMYIHIHTYVREFWSDFCVNWLSWGRVLPEKLTGFQLVEKSSTFSGTWRFITASTSVCHLSLSWAGQSSPCLPILFSVRHICHMHLPSHYFLCLQGRKPPNDDCT